MKPETCNDCPDHSCTAKDKGRVITDSNGRSNFTGVPIERCETREAFRMNLMELEDEVGLMPPRLLGC